MVATGTGKKLNAEQVQAVVWLVAKSVDGLEADQVTLVSSTGQVLSAAGQSDLAAGDARAKQTSEFETRMNSALQRMLDQALGAGHAVVQVTADLDFDSTSTTTQKYVADPSTPPLSEQHGTEKYTGTGSGTGGVLGPDNILVPGGTGGSGSYDKSTDTRNNAVGMVTETRKSAPGAVKRLAVAVLVDSAVAKDTDVAQLQQLVTSAAGLDTARGDTVAVSALKFDDSAAVAARKALAEEAAAASDAQLKSWIETGAMVFGVVVLLLMALLSGRKKRKKAKAIELTADERVQLEEMQAALEEAKRKELEGNGDAAAIGAGEGEGDGPVEISDAVRRQQNISALIERQPEEVAQLLRGWLADRRG